MEGPPPQYTIKNIDEYLEHLSRGVFQAGISWRVVESKWPGIKKAFHGFKVERVARMTDREAGRALGVGNSLRYAATTGTVAIRWEGARAPTGSSPLEIRSRTSW